LLETQSLIAKRLAQLAIAGWIDVGWRAIPRLQLLVQAAGSEHWSQKGRQHDEHRHGQKNAQTF